MTATYVLTNNIGKVRLKIGDTVIATAHFTDEEIQIFLTENLECVNLAAAAALEAWAASLAQNKSSESIGGDYSYSSKEPERMLQAAATLRETENNTPAADYSEMDLTDEEDELY